MIILLYFIFSFLIGAIPFGYLIPKIFKDIDIRNFGSCNPGATNVYRILGPGYGIPVFFLDFLKGLLPPFFVLFGSFSYDIQYLKLFFGLSSILGHIFTPFLKFKGGKGVATTAGVFCNITFIPFIICFFFFWIVFYLFKIVSIASISTSIIFPFTILIFQKNKVYFVFTVILSLLIIFRHKNNIIDLVKQKRTI